MIKPANYSHRLRYFWVIIVLSVLPVAKPWADVQNLYLYSHGEEVRASWNATPHATGYRLYYAPYPEMTPVSWVDLDTQTEFSTQLPLGSAYYLAVQPLQGVETIGELSNISFFQTAPEPEHQTIAIGNGGPTVVLESGLGDGLWPWFHVYTQLFRDVRTFAYSRAGYGESGDGPIHRSAVQIVGELRVTLRAAGQTPPYVLVGHSLGGLYMSLYAKLYPEEVAGLVLVDATPYTSKEQCDLLIPAELLNKGYCTLKDSILAMLHSPSREEGEAMEETRRLIRNAGAMPNIPVRVLSGDSHGQGDAYEQYWLDRQQEVATAYNGTLTVVQNSGHYIQTDQPHRVVSAVMEIVRGASQ